MSSVNCVCDPTFPNTVAASLEECPPCEPYLLGVSFISLIAVAWTIYVAWSHRELPGKSFRSTLMFLSFIFSIFRATRYLAVLLIPAENWDVISPLVWGMWYIFGTAAGMSTLIVISTHWTVVKFTLDWSQGFRPSNVVNAYSRRQIVIGSIVSLFLGGILVLCYVIPTFDDVSLETSTIATNAISPAIVGFWAFLSGLFCRRAGKAIGKILEDSPNAGIAPVRMNKLIRRVGNATFFGGLASFFGALVNLRGGVETTTLFLVKSGVFRLAETAGILVVVSTYKLPSEDLKRSLDRMNNEKRRKMGIEASPSVASVRADLANNFDTNAVVSPSVEELAQLPGEVDDLA